MDHPRLRLISAECKRDILDMINMAQSGHPGGSLSCIDILTAIYHNKHFRHYPENQNRTDDWFVLSKGHAAPALYATLAECGYFDAVSEKKGLYLHEYLWSLRKINSDLQGHPDMLKTPGVHFSTGALGHGFPASIGMALGIKMDKKDYNVYVVIGDGEFQEGMNHEALMFAANHNLNNLCVFLDKNDKQIDGRVSDINDIEPLYDKLRAYNWEVFGVKGHNYWDLLSALDYFHDSKKERKKPVMAIAYTAKDKPHGSPLEKFEYFKEKALLDIEIKKLRDVIDGFLEEDYEEMEDND